jgi:hypothetical protein
MRSCELFAQAGLDPQSSWISTSQGSYDYRHELKNAFLYEVKVYIVLKPKYRSHL